MEKKYLVCLICCEEFKGGCGGGDLVRKEENIQSLKQFCEVILEVGVKEGSASFLDKYEEENVKGGGCGRRGSSKWRCRSKESQKTIFEGDEEEEGETNVLDIPLTGLETMLANLLKNKDDHLSICRDCLDLIGRVTEARLSAKCVEESVEKLQMLLLRELRRLQGRLDMFWGEFKKMEETLATGDLKFMENRLDGSYTQKKEGGKKNKLTRRLDKMTQEHLERKREIFGFRGKISEVYRDFTQFKSKLVDKFACNPVSQTIRTATSFKKMVDAQTQVEIRLISKPKPTDKQPNHDKGLSSFLLDEIVHGDDSENDGGNIDDEPMHLDNSDDNDNFCEDNQVDFNPVDKRASLRCRDNKKKYIQNSSDSDDDPENIGEDEAEEFNPEEVSKTSPQVKRKLADKRSSLRRREKSKKNEKRKSSDDLVKQVDEQPSGKDDDDEDYDPDEPGNETLTYRAQIRNLLREYEPHLAQMSPFQRKIVRSIIRFQFHCENLQKRKGPENITVYQRHLVHLSYNVDTQLINIRDVPIKIVCQEDGEDRDNGLLCTKCDFKVSECPKMQTLMYDHVLSQHFNAYHCPHCSSKKITSFGNFRMHVWKCEKEPDVFKVVCDICGKSLCDKRALQNHKWRTHMSEQEKKEALETGLLKKAPEIKSTKGAEKKFQCEQCGKSFASKSCLQNHEITHEDRDSREQFICPKCGKSFLKAGYEYHSKHSVTCGEDDNGGRKETCGKCGKSFKNIWHLKRHVKEMHVKAELRGDSKPFVCRTCGKAYGIKASLIKHEITHSGEKPWICGQCGAAFSMKFSLRRHEATCAK